jgi:hypothetical protein
MDQMDQSGRNYGGCPITQRVRNGDEDHQHAAKLPIFPE